MWKREAPYVIIGVLIVGLTLHLYTGFDSSRPASKFLVSPSGADHMIDSAKSYLSSHPDDINANVALAMAYYQKGPDHYVDAMNSLDKARALGATDDHLFYYAGVMYEALGLPDYASNELEKYLRHHPNEYETTIRLANLYFRQKRLDEAYALYNDANHAWPKDATAWFNLAIIHKEKGNYPEALKCLEEVSNIAGRLPAGGLYQEGEIYRLKGDQALALQKYQQELAVDPAYIPALEATEAIIRAKGDLKQSRNLKKRIAELKKQQQPAAAHPNS
jgi:tetratricopeptide (TPR) repeat protein